MYERIVHPFGPLFRGDSKILILGTLPSVKSREQGFYYGNAQNRFWQVLAGVFECEAPAGTEEKKRFLYEKRIALWDVIESCDIIGSRDGSIKNAAPTDLKSLIGNSEIKAVFANGRKAEALYEKFQKPETGLGIVCLPSTSPANAAWSLERLIESWRRVAQALGRLN